MIALQCRDPEFAELQHAACCDPVQILFPDAESAETPVRRSRALYDRAGLHDLPDAADVIEMPV